MRFVKYWVQLGMGVGVLAGMLMSAQAEPVEFCDGEYITSDLVNCTGRNLEYEDSKLNISYKSLMGLLESASEKEQLKQAQRAWISFRDKSCDFTTRELAGGSMHTMVYNSCLTDRTYQRRIELDQEVESILSSQ
ncbi:lysozyme inhibitor LprI family protein [Psychrobacter sp. FDAARGOS_221]|uniref:lysozyme inhibitor LprI family protein n=1 Tax=Psychrobacter sp. FDAARGOS_221 TaxID=1975705 RepID=UPI000BB5641E|nr:lysozyme inhibitor LprI family protein [Psychrobacter sp. FDAARGOS_221]PNK59670.1 DUF1311 domain-containing protein [Psychrobacter sp. FDAARGOS_221]